MIFYSGIFQKNNKKFFILSNKYSRVNEDYALKIGFQNIDDDINKEEKSENTFPEIRIKYKKNKRRKNRLCCKEIYMEKVIYWIQGLSSRAIKLNLEVVP